MEQLSKYSEDIIMGIIGEKLAKLAKYQMSYDEALRELDEIESLYEKLKGERSKWDADLKKAVDGIRANINEFYSKKGYGISLC